MIKKVSGKKKSYVVNAGSARMLGCYKGINQLKAVDLEIQTQVMSESIHKNILV